MVGEVDTMMENEASARAESFEAIVSRAADRLVSVRHDPHGSFVTTPLLYPGGASIVVWVDRAYPQFTVSDFAFAYREVELMGGDTRAFNQAARAACENWGVTLGEDGSLCLLIDGERLEGGLRAVAGCAADISSRIAAALADARRADATSILYDRLVRAFGKPAVAKDVEIEGASQAKWNIGGLVRQGEQSALFDPVTPYFASVAATLAKFGDIRLLEAPPPRTSVLMQKDGFGAWHTALAQTSHVLERGAQDAAFQAAAGL